MSYERSRREQKLTPKLQSVTGFFTLHASSKLPFIFSVKRVRNGRSFAVRTVEVTQVAVDGVCFTSTMSFKRAEASDIEFQRPIKFQEHYAEAFKGRSAAQLPRSAGSEHPLMLQFKLGFYGPPFPGLVSKTLETDKDYNKERHPLDRRALSCFQVIGDMPPYDEAPNLHIAGYLYASDRNSLFSVARHLGVDENYGKMASLSHSVTLHNVGEAMSLVDRSGKPRWLYQEAWTDRMGDGRGVHQSRMYTDTDMHVATTLQDGLIRLQFDPEEDEKRERQRNLEEMQKRKVKL